MEEDAISMIIRLNKEFPTVRTHSVHLSASSAIPILRQARQEHRLPLTVETCHHYLTLEAESVAKGRTDYKCCPPIRSRDNRQALWSALESGDIDYIVSDHSPCVASLKKLDSGDFISAWGGIGGLGLGLSLIWTEALQRGFGLPQVMQWLAGRPAQQVGLQDTKGSLKVGADADFVIFDEHKQFTVGLNRKVARLHG